MFLVRRSVADFLAALDRDCPRRSSGFPMSSQMTQEKLHLLTKTETDAMQRLILATFLLVPLAVSASANHCIKPNRANTDVIVNALRAIQHGAPKCPERKKALAAATALRKLSMQEDCYHGHLSGMAANVQRETAQEEDLRGSVQSDCK